MLSISIDDSELRNLAATWPARHYSAAKSAIQSVSYEMSKYYAAYARTGPHGPFAPLTVATRKQFKGGYGAWIARFTRYYVDPNSLQAQIGVLSKGDIGQSYFKTPPQGAGELTLAKLRPISGGFSKAAKRHARGYGTRISKENQRKIAKALMKVYGKDADWIHKLIPSLGFHRVKARPIARPVYETRRAWAISAVRSLYKIKMEGLRYSRSWARDFHY